MPSLSPFLLGFTDFDNGDTVVKICIFSAHHREARYSKSGNSIHYLKASLRNTSG
jgi:hypothetical protein